VGIAGQNAPVPINKHGRYEPKTEKLLHTQLILLVEIEKNGSTEVALFTLVSSAPVRAPKASPILKIFPHFSLEIQHARTFFRMCGPQPI